MPSNNPDDATKKGNSGEGSDSEDSLQAELQKESAEGAGSIGDVKSNRNVTGASSWDTLPDKSDNGDSKSGK